eukprot:265734-Rhodomonas_salina.1
MAASRSRFLPGEVTWVVSVGYPPTVLAGTDGVVCLSGTELWLWYSSVRSVSTGRRVASPWI